MFGAAPLLGTPLRVLSSPTRIVGVSTGLNDDEVVVTQQAQGVAVYNVSSRARVAAWELPAAVRLTHAAQVHGPSRQYVVVRDHTRLLGWAETDNAIDAEAGLTFDQPIATLLQSPALHDCLAAVPMDGSAIVLRAAVGASSRSASSVAVATVPAPDGDELTVWACLTPMASAASGAPLPLCILVLSRSNSAALTLRVRALEPHLGGDGGASAPLLSVGVLPARTVELGPPPPPPAPTGALSLVAAASGGRAKRGAMAKAAAPSLAESTPHVSGCCVVPATGGGVAGAEAGGRGATLMLLWSTGQMQLWDVLPPLDRSHHGARGVRKEAMAQPGSSAATSTGAAEPAHPRCSRSLRGLALPSLPSRATAPAATSPAFPAPGAGHLSSQPLPSGLLALGASPLVLLLAAGAGAGARTPPAPFSLTPRLEPRAWPELASADRPAAAPHPMSLGSSPALGPALGSGRVVLQVWDARFGMLHAHRRDTADELPPGSRGSVCGAALCGGRRWVALAFDDAVLALSVPPPHQTFGLVHALNAAVRTADALSPEEAAALTRPPLCAAPFISSVLPAHAPQPTHPPAAASAAAAPPARYAPGAPEGGKRGKGRHGAKRGEATASAAAPPPSSAATPSPLVPSRTSSHGLPSTDHAPAGRQAAGHRPVPVAASELCGWRERVLSGAARESAVLSVLLDPATQAPAFESALGAFLATMAEEAAARAADEEGHPHPPGGADDAGRGASATTGEDEAAGQQRGAAAVEPVGKRRHRGSNGASGGANGNGAGTAAGGEGARACKRARGASGPGATGSPESAQAPAAPDGISAAAAAGDGRPAGASGGNAGVRAGLSLAAALDGESQPPDGTSYAGSGRARGALYVSAGFVSSVCERCVHEGSVEWLRLLKPLIEVGALPSGAQEPNMLQALCAVRELDLLMTYVRHAADLDAANLLLLLRLSLRECARASAEAPAAALSAPPARAVPASPCGGSVPSNGPAASNGRAAAGGSVVAARVPAAEHWGTLLDLLICAPRNDVFLLEALRWLSPSDALLLLSRLLDLFHAYAGAWRLDSAAADADGWHTPAISQLVGWTNVLLDAHASQLLMHTPAHGPLRSLGGLVRRHVQLCGAMKGLKGYLSQATLKQAQPIKPIPDYSVEILEM